MGSALLKGRYKVNETENQRSVLPGFLSASKASMDRGNLSDDINNNHRYTIGITEADDLRLEFTLRVADWTDDGSIDDYEPTTIREKLRLLFLMLIKTGQRLLLDPDRNVYTVSMSLDAGSSFDMTVGSASPGIKIVYAGGPSAQSNNWLTLYQKCAYRLGFG